MNRRLVVVGPIPPPFHGVSISTRLVLAGRELNRRFDVEHFDTSDHRTGTNVGQWESRNALLALLAICRFRLALRGRQGTVYLPISQGLPGLTRDCVLILLAARAGWNVAIHLRGSELADVTRKQGLVVRRLLGRAFRRIDGVAVLGESVRSSLEGIVPAERVSVVGNGSVDPGSRGWPTEPLLGLVLSNYSARKGVIEAMEGAIEATRQEPGLRIVFAGDDSEPSVAERLRELATGSAGRIEVRGTVRGTEKRRLLQSAGFLLFTPREPEGQPRVVLEAMAAGLPVISTDRGTIAETLGPGSADLVLADPDPRAIAQRVLRLVRDPELREARSLESRRRFERLYTAEAADRALTDWLLAIDSGRSSSVEEPLLP